MTKKIYLVIATGVIVLAASASVYVFFFSTHPDARTTGLTKVSGYNENGVCAAMDPACGLCYGEVIDKQCYVDKTKLTAEQLRYMGF